MTFLTQNLKNIFKNTITQVIEEFGVNIELVLPEEEQDCPNCIYDGIKKRSSNRYDSSNPYDESTGMNKPFVDGQICPVCNGRGKLTFRENNVTILCTTQWAPKDYDTVQGLPINLPADVCKCKTKAEYYYSVKNAIEFLVDGVVISTSDTNKKRCELVGDIIPRGLATDKNFIQFYLKVK